MGRREDAHVDLDRAPRADRRDLAVLQHAEDLALQLERHVADLVEEDRPAVRRLELALARRQAPVNAPFSWPNSSLSMSCSGIAAQLTGMNGIRARGESEWIVRATTSLPTPVSPRIRTM
jgi:hypothetical protein